ncbi:hypothetical protein V8D89_011248 [Ganoderma adspersum]
MRGLDSFSDMFTGEIAPRGMIRDPLSSAPAAVPPRWSERQSGSPSTHSPPFLSPDPLPQHAHSSQPYYRVSFVPSLDSPLSSATSSSGFHTPSFNRGSSSSSANISSPPVTPASASSSSAPRDAANRPSNAKLHGILEEPLFAEEPAIDYRRRRHARRSTDETETIRLEELLDKDKEDSPALTTRSSPHPPRVELAFIREGGLPPLRSDSLSPSDNWKKGSPYTPRTPEFAPPSEYSPKSIDFPRLSVDSPSPNDPSFSSPPCGKFTPSPSPSQHAELKAEDENENERCAWPGVRKWRSQTPIPTSPGRLSPSPSPAHGPAPLSPVISVHSDHSVTGSIRSGITKLFGLGGGGGRRSRSGSKSAGVAGASAEPARSSDSFDWAPPPPPSTTSTVSLGSLASAGSKADERRLRKEAAKARTERLAQDLAERARKRAVEGKARTAAYVQEKNLRPWEEAGAMYQGLSYL